ncbi:hypothetical protein [Corynebacterium aurimucosum]|uniref:hypothetical protein n=1 Tax=Corynebacterium aurimucosum TaxID=169292 RepID=UPI000C7FBCD6|nr:hypothetical protein [Corynebacterium aurimucosum]PMC71855.1 hypothetical protein CJ201_01765 [Corynebacterium aurimucosum]
MRLSTSLIAVCTTTMALVAPLAAADDASGSAQAQSGQSSTGGSSMNIGHTNTSDLSEECAEAVRKAREEHENAVADDTAGSSFMGPKELGLGILNGYGSSGMPEVPDCVQEEKDAELEKEWDEMPDWVQSARPNDTAEEVFAWIGGAAALLSVGINLLAAVAQSNPAVLNDLRAFLKSHGFYWDNTKKKDEADAAEE